MGSRAPPKTSAPAPLTGSASWLPDGTTETANLGESDLTGTISSFTGTGGEALSLEDTVHSYYFALTRGDFETAYGLLADRRRSQVGDVTTWSQGLQGNQYAVADISVIGQQNGTPVIDVDYRVDYARGPARGTCEQLTVRRAVPIERAHLRLDSLVVVNRRPC